MRLQHICKMLAEQRLGCGSDSITLFQLVNTAHSNPGALRCKTFHVILFFLQQTFGNQQRHIDILNANLFKLGIHNPLDVFPNGIAIGTVNKYTLNGRIINQLRLLTYVGKPLCKVYLHICNLFNLFIFRHDEYILSLA